MTGPFSTAYDGAYGKGESASTSLAEWFAVDVDMRHNELLNAAVHNQSVAPASPVKGQLWFDTSLTPGTLKYWDGTQWTGGRTYYNTVLDDGVAKAQRSKLNLRSTVGIGVDVIDESASDQSSVVVSPRFGPVVPVTSPGASSADGTAQTLARSDHSHGAPAGSGADSVLISWWEFNESLWAQLTPTASFVPDLPGQVVGGGWTLTAPGSIYWTGAVIPMSDQSVYRNSIRVSALNSTSGVSCGWLCYDANKSLLGQVRCINAVAVRKGTESGSLLSRNYIPEPSAEKAFTTDPASDFPETWHSNGVFGAGAIATVTQTTEQVHGGSRAVKAVWPELTSGTTQSNALIRSGTIPPGTKVTASGWVYVPSGSPDVRLDVTYYASSAYTSLKNQWVRLEVQFTTPSDIAHDYFCGMTMETPGQAGKVAYIDDVMLRTGWDPMPDGRTYFDGDTPDTDQAIFAWDGTSQDSTSSWYSIEPEWSVITGYIAGGDGVEPPAGESATIEDAVAPLDGTVYFRPYIGCDTGTLVIDTHEVARGTRDMTVLDGLRTGWVHADGSVQAGNVVTPDIAPPDTLPETLMRIGPVYDPPQADGDVVPKSYVDRIFGAFGVDEETGELPPIPTQFLWSGDPGVDPTPTDLGFVLDAWPLYSLWFDTSVAQVSPMALAGTWQGTGSVSCPSVGTTWTQVPETYGVVITPPVDGTIVGISSGSVYATYTNYMEMQCRCYAGVDVDGNGGALAGASGQQIFSPPSGDTVARQGYTLLTFAQAVGKTRYKLGTYYTNGGSGVSVTRDRTFVLFIPGMVSKP